MKEEPTDLQGPGIARVLVSSPYWSTGIPNVGNTCFFNAAFQNAMNMSFLLQFLFRRIASFSNLPKEAHSALNLANTYFIFPSESKISDVSPFTNNTSFRKDIEAINLSIPDYKLGGFWDSSEAYDKLEELISPKLEYQKSDFDKNLLNLLINISKFQKKEENGETTVSASSDFLNTNTIYNFGLNMRDEVVLKDNVIPIEELENLMKRNVRFGKNFSIINNLPGILGNTKEKKEKIFNMSIRTINLFGRKVIVKYKLVGFIIFTGNVSMSDLIENTRQGINVTHFYTYVCKNGTWFEGNDSSREIVEEDYIKRVVDSRKIRRLFYELESYELE